MSEIKPLPYVVSLIAGTDVDEELWDGFSIKTSSCFDDVIFQYEVVLYIVPNVVAHIYPDVYHTVDTEVGIGVTQDCDFGTRQNRF